LSRKESQACASLLTIGYNTAMSKEIWFPARAPRGLHQSLGEAMVDRAANIHAGLSGLELQARLEEIDRQRWTEITGQVPEQSRFLLLVPIYNEERALPSFLANWQLLLLPKGVKATIVFGTNNCSDESCQIVDSFLAKTGKVEPLEIRNRGLGDESLCEDGGQVFDGNLRYIHLDSGVGNKANMQTVANNLASQLGYEVTMCVDANIYPTREAIAAIYSHAYKSFAGNSRTVLVTGEQRAERRKSAWVKLAGKRWKETAFTNRKEADVSGWLMAWKTEWVKQIGGVPRTATEDYALGLKARLMGYGVEIANALAWGYGSNNPSDVLCEYTRYIRGMIQAKEEFMDVHPQVVELIKEDRWIMRRYPERIASLIERIQQEPHKLPVKIVSFIIMEAALRQATWQIKQGKIAYLETNRLH